MAQKVRVGNHSSNRQCKEPINSVPPAYPALTQEAGYLRSLLKLMALPRGTDPLFQPRECQSAHRERLRVAAFGWVRIFAELTTALHQHIDGSQHVEVTLTLLSLGKASDDTGSP